MKRVLRFLFDIAVYVTCALALLLSPLRYVRRLITKGRINSIWAGTPIINMATNARAERLLGVNARSLVYSTYFTTSDFDYNLSTLARVPVLGRLLPLAVFVWGCIYADRFHFYCDRGLLPSRTPFTFDFRELIVYRWLGIPVLLWTYGADIRSTAVSRAMGEPNTCTHCDKPGGHCICDPVKTARNMQRLASLSNAVFAGVGDMFGYTPGSIDDTFFWPIDLDALNGEKYRPVPPDQETDRPLRVVHSTNHRIFKGTDYLSKAVTQLQNEGVQIELVLVEKVPNRQALEIYRSADVIFDNCIMGNVGYFGLEGMALAKPVMCFVRDSQNYLLAPDECPIINTHVKTLNDDLRRIYDERGTLTDIGLRSRKYIEKYFTLPAFAERLRTTYEKIGIPT